MDPMFFSLTGKRLNIYLMLYPKIVRNGLDIDLNCQVNQFHELFKRKVYTKSYLEN